MSKASMSKPLSPTKRLVVQIVDAVKANGVPVEYIVFEDEGHGFAKKKTESPGMGQSESF